MFNVRVFVAGRAPASKWFYASASAFAKDASELA
jgi:hypothetical protein